MAKMSETQALEVYRTAVAAADAALAKADAPTPMVVGSPTHPLGNDINPAKGPVYYVPGGLCGFGTIKMPANTPFARHMMKAGVFRKSSTESGCRMYVQAGDQSYELKRVWAGTFAGALREQGVAKVYADVRVD